MGNCGPHGADIQNFCKQIEILTFLLNFTSLHQQLHMNIIAAWKKRYRHHMFCEIIVESKFKNERRDISATVQAGMRVLSKRHVFYMLDVKTTVKHSRYQVSRNTISCCGVKAKVLSEIINVDLNAEFGSMRDNFLSLDIHEIVTKMQKRSLNVERSNSLYENVRDLITSQGDTTWGSLLYK